MQVPDKLSDTAFAALNPEYLRAFSTVHSLRHFAEAQIVPLLCLSAQEAAFQAANPHFAPPVLFWLRLQPNISLRRLVLSLSFSSA